RLISNFFFSSRRRHTRSKRDWSSDVCSSDLGAITGIIHIKFKVRDLLAGIITMMALYSINLRIVGKANVTLMNTNSIFDIFNMRSEERRVGKEGRYEGGQDQVEKRRE